MIMFILVAIAMTLFALGVLLPVLWRNKTQEVADIQQANVLIAEEQLEQLRSMHQAGDVSDDELRERRTELELSLASSLANDPNAAGQQPAGKQLAGPVTSVLLALILPACAGFLYLKIGTPEALDAEFLASQQQQPAADSVASIDELLPRLEAHLAETPDDLRGWRLLGVTYLRMQRFEDAQNALSKALELAPEDVDVMLQLADAKAMNAGGSLLGEPEGLVQKALELRPDDLRALWLLGMLHREKNAHESALEIWNKLNPLLDDEPEAQNEVLALAAEARAALGMSAEETPTSDTKASASTPAGDNTAAGITVKVNISPKIEAELAPEYSVFIYAKAVKGPPMPLAVFKKSVSDLPLEVTLDDSLAMVAGMNLSAFTEVIVGARVSISGNPVAGSGDFYTEVQPITPGQSDAVELTIDTPVP